MGLETWDRVEDCYGEEVVNRLAAKYDIDPVETNLEWWLHNAGVDFLNAQYIHSAVSVRSLRKRQLSEIIKRSDQLLVSMSEIIADEVYPLHEMSVKRNLVGPPASSEKGQSKLREWGWHEKQWRTYVEVGRDYAIEELGFLKVNKGGRPNNKDYYDFVRYLIQFWEDELNRRFTFDHINKTGLTQSYLFIRDCLEALTPVDETKLVSAIRRELQKYSTYKKPRPKK